MQGATRLNLPVLGVAPASLRQYSFYPSLRSMSSPQSFLTSNATHPCKADARGAPCRPAGWRPAPGCAGASDGMARNTSRRACSAKASTGRGWRTPMVAAEGGRIGGSRRGNRQQNPNLRAFQSPFTPCEPRTSLCISVEANRRYDLATLVLGVNFESVHAHLN